MTTTAATLDRAPIDEDVLKDFVPTLKSPQTRRTYDGALRRWLAWLGDREPDRDAAQAWVDHLLASGLRDNTVATYAGAIRHLWKWKYGAPIYLQAPGIDTGEPKYHPISEINQMIELAGPLERTIIGVMFSAGVRLAECLLLETQKIAWDRNLINVVAKGGDDEDVNISDGGLEYLRAWLDIRVGDPPLVFWDYIGGRNLDNKSRGVRRKLEALAARVGMEDFTPHHLRHSRAMDLLDSGVSLERVSELMRHDNIQTTIKFYGKRRPQDRQADLEKGAELPPQGVPSRYLSRKVRP